LTLKINNGDKIDIHNSTVSSSTYVIENLGQISKNGGFTAEVAVDELAAKFKIQTERDFYDEKGNSRKPFLLLENCTEENKKYSLPNKFAKLKFQGHGSVEGLILKKKERPRLALPLMAMVI
jgi:hypothetical protein